MGVQGLLKYVPYREGHINEFSGCKIGVDTSCLLHRCFHAGISPGRYIGLFTRMLLENNISEVIYVLDGKPWSTKRKILQARAENRRIQHEKSEKLMQEGKVDEAVKCANRSIPITPDVILEFCETIRALNLPDTVKVIQAPYEADAQLGYLASQKIVDAIITEDSDLILYDAPVIVYKLKLSGICAIFEQKKLLEQLRRELPGITDVVILQEFRRVCILAGCDYLPKGLKGWGIRTGLRAIRNSRRTIRDILSLSKEVGEDFFKELEEAEQSFIAHTIFDPVSNTQRSFLPV